MTAARTVIPPATKGQPAGPALRRWPPLLAGVLAWAATAALIGLLGYTAIRHPPYLTDLRVYRTAGRDVLAGRPVYRPVPRARLASLGRSYLVFTYPPFAALLAVPLALVSWRAAEIAWIPVVYGSLAIVVRLAFAPLLAAAGRWRAAAFGAVTGACALMWPLLQEIRFGQVDMALAALCTLDVATRRPRWPRGLLVGLATAIKLTPGAFLAYLLITGRRRAALTAAAAAGGATLAAWALLPSASAFYWSTALWHTRRLGRPGQVSDQSIQAMLIRAFAPAPVPRALWLLLALAAAAAGLAAARAASRRGNEMAAIAIVGLASVLASPVSWIHHIVWVVVAAGAILSDGRRAWRWLAALATADFFVFYDPYALRRTWWSGYAPHLIAQVRRDAYGIASAVLIAVLAALPRAASRGGPAPAGRESAPPPPSGPAPGCSTAPDGSAPAVARGPGARDRPPGPR